jgi:hypothetical protein
MTDEVEGVGKLGAGVVIRSVPGRRADVFPFNGGLLEYGGEFGGIDQISRRMSPSSKILVGAAIA